MKIFFRLPRIGIITAPIDQIFGIVPNVNSLALYLLDDPLFVGSLEFSSQPLFVEEIVAHYTRICVVASHVAAARVAASIHVSPEMPCAVNVPC